MRKKVGVKEMRARRKRRSLTKLVTILSAGAAFVVLESFYFLRELLLFAAIAALLVFFAATIAVLGILAQAATESMFRSVRAAKARAVSQANIEGEGTNMKLKLWPLMALYIVLVGGLPLAAQQKGQYIPGQFGLNAGILPSPGFTYANMDLNYNPNTINDAAGNAISAKANLNLWVIENIYYYVPNTRFLGGNLGFMMIIPTIANGSLTLEQVNVSGSTYGLADSWFQPFTLGWHLKRADIQVGDAFMVPTGRYTPGALNNIGSGYFGNHAFMGTTVYLTKNKGTSANIFTDWEVHGQKQITNGHVYKRPGQAFTDEWGVGQVLPLRKDLSKLIQLGVIGYDQWQLTDDQFTAPLGTTVPGPSPYYSVHAVGGQANFIMPPKNLAFFFKYLHEYKSYSRPLGNTIVFGGSWTLRIPEH